MPLTPEQSQMVEDNIKLAYSTAWKLVPKFSLDFDEILSICLLSLCKSTQKFDPSRGFKFSTFAVNTMYYAVLAVLNPPKPQIKTMYLEDVFNSDNGQTWENVLGTYGIENEIVCQVAAEQIIASLDNIKMNETYKEIMRIHFREPELLQEEIGQMVGCSQKNVWWAFKKTREKLRPMVCMG